jgi:hypothetical protein
MSLSTKTKAGIGAISRNIINPTGTRDGIITKARLHIFFCIRECIHEEWHPALSGGDVFVVQIEEVGHFFWHCDGNWDNGVSSSCRIGLVELSIY